MRIFSYIYFFLWINSGFSQLQNPIIGKEYSTDRKENFNGFIGENSSTLFTIDYLYITRKKQELIVRKFLKSDLQLVDSKNIYENPPDEFYGEPLEVFYKRDTIYMFSNLFDEKQKITFITLELFTINCEKISSAYVDTLADDEDLFVQEENDGHGFILAKANKYSNLTEQSLDLKYVNSSGNIEWQKTLKSPMALQNITIEKIRFRKNEPIFVLCNYAYEPPNSINGEDKSLINNKYAIWAYNKDTKFLKEFEIRLKGKWVNGVDIELNSANQLILSGFFNETRYNSVAGSFSLLVDHSLKIINSNYFKFDDVILQKFIEEKDRGKTKDLEDYSLKDMTMLNNGSYFLMGERYFKQIERNYDPRTNITTTTEHYNYNSIIVSYFDSLGNHVWTDRIPKFQNTQNDYGYFSSFTYLNNGEELFIFFNDSDKNNELALNDYFNYKGLFNNRRFQISYVHVDKSGPVKRGVLIGVENSYILRAKACHQISENTMFLLGEVGKEAKIFSVEKTTD